MPLIKGNAPIENKAWGASSSGGSVALIVTTLIVSIPFLKNNIPLTAVPAIVAVFSGVAALIGAYVPKPLQRTVALEEQTFAPLVNKPAMPDPDLVQRVTGPPPTDQPAPESGPVTP